MANKEFFLNKTRGILDTGGNARDTDLQSFFYQRQKVGLEAIKEEVIIVANQNFNETDISHSQWKPTMGSKQFWTMCTVDKKALWKMHWPLILLCTQR